MIDLFKELPVITGDRITIKPVTAADREGLLELVNNDNVYKYLPSFLFERKYEDIDYVISHLYTECIDESLILGVFINSTGEFCGLIELYGYKDYIHKISIGYRYIERFWGQGIAAETLGCFIDYIEKNTDIEIITASTMLQNKASAKVLIKNDFDLVVSGSPEDWGFEEMTPSDKWIR